MAKPLMGLNEKNIIIIYNLEYSKLNNNKISELCYWIC